MSQGYGAAYNGNLPPEVVLDLPRLNGIGGILVNDLGQFWILSVYDGLREPKDERLMPMMTCDFQ